VDGDDRVVELKTTNAGTRVEPVQALGRVLDDGPAWEYACAFQRRDFDRVIGLTWWMQERLDRVRLEWPDSSGVEQAAADLRRRLATYSVEGNQLRPEGIEDQYVFAPGAVLSVVRRDAGRDDLAKDVAERMWIRVIYPDERHAPRNEFGRPIREMTVGINVATDGFVLKASVIGNVEFERDLIQMW